MKRILCIVATLTITSVAAAQDSYTQPLGLSDQIVVDMTGEVVGKYLPLIGESLPPSANLDAVGMTVVAKIMKIGPSGRIQVQNSQEVKRKNGQKLLTMITVEFDRSSLRPPHGIIAPGTFDSFDLRTANQQRELARKKSMLPYVRVSEMDGVTLRNWKVVVEVLQN